MEAKETQKREREIITLRTWLFYNVAATYVFTDLNVWIAMGVAAGLELFFSLFVYIFYNSITYSQRMQFIYIDIAVALLMCIVAPFELAVFEYIFDGVAFIGDSKEWTLVGILIAINVFRIVLMFLAKEVILISVMAIAFVPIFVTFMVLITNQSFYADAHSISVVLNFVWITLLTCTIMTFILSACKVISYFAYMVHFIVLLIIVLCFQSLHSDRSFSYYL
jgi:hypothetical protein